ncbi:hypothetical protein [Nonomuraea sp. NPDC050786]
MSASITRIGTPPSTQIHDPSAMVARRGSTLPSLQRISRVAPV